jgi:hypothetical protein
MFHFVYYSYEEWGRGYIGVHSTKNIDDGYFGSYRDPNFSPTQRIIISFFDTREEAKLAEITLHEFFKVESNPHFANILSAKAQGFDHGGLILAAIPLEQRKLFGSRGGKRYTPKKAAALAEARKKQLEKQGMKCIAENMETGQQIECVSIQDVARKLPMSFPTARKLYHNPTESFKGWRIIAPTRNW